MSEERQVIGHRGEKRVAVRKKLIISLTEFRLINIYTALNKFGKGAGSLGKSQIGDQTCSPK
jgi:hypothetical protein